MSWLAGLFASIRKTHEPSQRVVLIPFDRRLEATSALCEQFDVQLFDDNEILTRLDAIGERLKPNSETGAHTFRKLAVLFDAPGTFLFLDSDVVVLNSLQRYKSILLGANANFVYLDEDIDAAYKPGAFRDQMVAQHSARGFNSGIFGGRGGWLTWDHLHAKVSAAAIHSGSFASQFEQSFLNFLVDSSSDCHVAAFRDFDHAIGGSWAGYRTTRDADGRLRITDERWMSYYGANYAYIDLLHWAGYAYGPLMPKRQAWLRSRHPESHRKRCLTQARDLVAYVTSPSQVWWTVKNASRRIHGWMQARGWRKPSQTEQQW